MSSKTFWILAAGLWACMITIWVALDGLPRAGAMTAVLLVWIGLSVERWRNLQNSRRHR